MILVRVRLVALLLAVSLVATTGAGIWSYRTALSADLKGPAETALFLSLGAAGLLVLIGLALFRQARRRQKELDSIADAVKYGGALPSERLVRFGPLGDRIRFILKELSEAGERKSERIASLTGLLRGALELVEDPVLVVSLDGKILEASRGAREDPRFKELETGKTRVEDLAAEVQIRSVLQEADRTHAAVEIPGHIAFHPVYSTRGKIGHFLVDFSKSGIRDFLNGLGERRTAAEADRKKSSLFRRFAERMGKNESKKS